MTLRDHGKLAVTLFFLFTAAPDSLWAAPKPVVRLRVETVGLKPSEFEKGLARRISAKIRKAKGLVLTQGDPEYILKVSGKTLPPSKKGQASTQYLVSVSFLANFRDAYKAKLLEVVEPEYRAKSRKFLDSDLVIFSDQILHHGRLASIDAECDALADVFIRELSPSPAAPAKKAAARK